MFRGNIVTTPNGSEGDRVDFSKGSQVPAGPGFSPPGSQPGQPPQDQYGQNQYGQPPQYGQNQYQSSQYGGNANPAQAGGYQQVGNRPSPSEENTWSMVCHLGGLVTAVTGYLGWIAPLVLYIMYKDRSPVIRHHAAQSLNFQIMVFIGMVISAILMLVVVGFVTFAILWLASIILPIIGAVQANKGEPYSYPLTPQLVK